MTILTVLAAGLLLVDCDAQPASGPVADPGNSEEAFGLRGTYPPAALVQAIESAADRSDFSEINQLLRNYVSGNPCPTIDRVIVELLDRLPADSNNLLCLRYELDDTRKHCGDCDTSGITAMGYLADGCNYSSCVVCYDCDVRADHQCAQ